MHRARGWNGIAYHYYIRKDGSIYRGRPEWMIGGHTLNWNWCSIGVCFEGNFEKDTMPAAQVKSGVELVADLKARHPGIMVIGHRDVNATDCPGRNFPMETMKAAVLLPDEEDENMVRYHDVMDAPDWARPTLNKLINLGALRGTDGGLDLSEDMVRLLVINDRMGVYGK